MINSRYSLFASLVLLVASLPLLAADDAAREAGIAAKTEHQINAYLSKLADLHCTESVLQEKLSDGGHVQAAERAKYDYLIMMDGDQNNFQLNESRVESSASPAKPMSMLVTNGFSTLMLIFHPYYRDSFQFEPLPDEDLDGRQVAKIRFSHIAGRRTPVALALRGREFPLELEGTAWIDPQSGDVLKIDASLQHDMNDIGLRSLNVHVEYKPTVFGKNSAEIPLPSLAVVEVATPRQHWKNTHVFDAYKQFSTDAEQDSDYKLRTANEAGANGNTAQAVTKDTKEKP